MYHFIDSKFRIIYAVIIILGVCIFVFAQVINQPQTAKRLFLPDYDRGGNVIFNVQTENFSPLLPGTFDVGGQEKLDLFRKVGDLLYEDGEGGILVATSTCIALIKNGTEDILTAQPPAELVTEKPMGLVQGSKPGDFVLFKERQGGYILMLIVAEMPRGLQLVWLRCFDSAQPFLKEQIMALRREAELIENERREEEEKRRPKLPVVREDTRTPDEKLMALAKSCNKIPENELQEKVLNLLKNGANVNARSSAWQNLFPITLAIWNGSFVMVKILVENGADIKASGATALAVDHGHLDILQYLLDNGGSIDDKGLNGKRLLQIALQSDRRNDDIIKFLRDRGAVIASLHTAAEAGDLDAIRKLVAAGADVNAPDAQEYFPLDFAARAGHLDACKLLIELGAKTARVQGRMKTTLEYVIYFEKFDMVPFFIENTPPEALRHSMLLLLGKHQTELLRQILTRMPEPLKMLRDGNYELQEILGNEELQTISDGLMPMNLMMASENELAVLKEFGYELPLWAAAHFGDLERIKELLTAGENVNKPLIRRNNATPLSLAVRNGQHAAAKLLLEKGASPDQRGDHEPTPLHEAVEKNNIEMARILLAHGANPNLLNAFNHPPLYYAVTAENLELCRVLLEGKADPNMRVRRTDATGRRKQIPIAELATDPELIKLLKRYR